MSAVVVPFRRSCPPDVPALTPHVPVLVARRAPDVPAPEPDGAGSAGVIVWVLFSMLGGFGIGAGLLTWALWP